MILRIVGLPVAPGRQDELQVAFDDAYGPIRSLPDCLYLALLRSDTADREYLTVSLWTSREALADYRRSELFAAVWPRIRVTLAGKAWARSYEFRKGEGPWAGPGG